MLRGLTIDKKRGNILKIDRHKYVKLAHHGFEPLTHEQRLSTYNAAEVSFWESILYVAFNFAGKQFAAWKDALCLANSIFPCKQLH